METNISRMRWIAWLVLILGLATAACSPQPASEATIQAPPAEPTEIAFVETPTSMAGEDVQNSPAVTQTAVEEIPPTAALGTEMVEPATPAPEAETTEPPPAPAPRTELEASDPATVQLASGKVQLVEFFAFW